MDHPEIGRMLAIGIIVALVFGAQSLLSAKGEGARRIRAVLLWAGGLASAAVVFALGGPVAVVITLVILGAIVWVVKGFNK